MLHDNACLGLWKIEEEESFFLEELDLQPAEQAELALIRDCRRRSEWLACRYLAHQMLLEQGAQERIPLLKDDCGKPHIQELPLHLSMSHSHGLVAVALAEVPVGVDIQRYTSRIGVLAHKFMRPEELDNLQESSRLEHLHFYWGAKEALYKAYGRRQIDFRQNLLVEPFDYREIGRTTASVCKDDFLRSYDVCFEKDRDNFLVYCLEKTCEEIPAGN